MLISSVGGERVCSMTDLLENQAQRQQDFLGDYLKAQGEYEESLKNRSDYMSKPQSLQGAPSWFTRLYGRTITGGLTTAGDLQSRLKRLVDVEYEVEQDPIRRGIKEVIDSHPEWSPREIKNVWEVITTPTEMVERVAESSSYVGGAMVSRMIGGWIGKAVGGVVGSLGGPAGTAAGAVGGALIGQHIAGWAFSYLVTSQRAYETSLEAGASERDARVTSEAVGALVATIELVPFGLLGKIGKGQAQAVKTKILQRALERGVIHKAVQSHGRKEIVRLMAAEAVEEVLQEAAEEIIPYKVYGKTIEPGFVDRMLQAGLGGAAMGVVFGKGVKLLGTAKGKITGTTELRKNAKVSLEEELGRPPTRSETNDRMIEFRNAESMFVENALAPLKKGIVPKSYEDLRKLKNVKVDKREDIDTELPESVKDTAKDLYDNGTRVADAVDTDEKLKIYFPVLTQETIDALGADGFEVDTTGDFIEVSFLKQGLTEENLKAKIDALDDIVKKTEGVGGVVEPYSALVAEDDGYDFDGLIQQISPYHDEFYRAFWGPLGFTELEYDQFIFPRIMGMAYAWGEMYDKPPQDWFKERIKSVERVKFEKRFLSEESVLQFQSVTENRLLWSKLKKFVNQKIAEANPRIQKLAKHLTQQTPAEELRWTGIMKFLDRKMEEAKASGVSAEKATVSRAEVIAFVKDKTPKWVVERREDYEDTQYRVKPEGRNYHEYLVLMDEQRMKEALGDEDYRRLVDESVLHYSGDVPLMLWVAADKIMAADGTSIFRPFEVQSDYFQAAESRESKLREVLRDNRLNSYTVSVVSPRSEYISHLSTYYQQISLADPDFSLKLAQRIELISPGSRPTRGILSINITATPVTTRKIPIMTSTKPMGKRGSISLQFVFRGFNIIMKFTKIDKISQE